MVSLRYLVGFSKDLRMYILSKCILCISSNLGKLKENQILKKKIHTLPQQCQSEDWVKCDFILN